jgi:6-pyruvoyltetrahydropterin/6-carboxytetrahydropterin synthase
MFDYGIIKQALRELCDELDEQMILPAHSPHLTIEEDGDYSVAIFNGERLPFLSRDLTVLPIANSTVEEISHYLLGLLVDHSSFAERGIIEMTVKVSSSPGQTGCSTWKQT